MFLSCHWQGVRIGRADPATRATPARRYAPARVNPDPHGPYDAARPRPHRSDPPDWPVWCCAILRDLRGRFIFERRPSHEIDAPGMLTCFGGGREAGEEPETCLRRELVEELGWRAGALELCVVLTTPKGVAWFYRGAGPEEGTVTALEAGYVAEWIEPAALAAAGVGGWNLAAIDAEMRGLRVARAD